METPVAFRPRPPEAPRPPTPGESPGMLHYYLLYPPEEAYVGWPVCYKSSFMSTDIRR